MTWESVIGLEVHAQLQTASKLFSGAATQYDALSNTEACYIDVGLPGVLPVLNKEAIKLAIIFGLAIKAEINRKTYFERKNYFYPDLPKGYQISQYHCPIIKNGKLPIEVSGNFKEIIIERAHLEEDAGKLLHAESDTGIDFNRAGIPLLEIVTTPCIDSAEECVTYLKTLQQLLRFLAISDGNMQEGSFRCDVNFSLRPAGATGLGVRTELKNLNSFRNIVEAIHFEQQRHQDLLTAGGKIVQETRGFDPTTGKTFVMRTKENAPEYRYFPDPDLLPIYIDETELISTQQNMPILPQQLKNDLYKLGILEDDIEFLLSDPSTISFCYATQATTAASLQTIIHWLRNIYSAWLNKLGLTFKNPPVSASNLGGLLNYVQNKTISTHRAKEIFAELINNTGDLDKLVTKTTMPAQDLQSIIDEVMRQFPEQIAEYRAGKHKLLAFFVGQVLKTTKGKAEPNVVGELVRKYLGRQP